MKPHHFLVVACTLGCLLGFSRRAWPAAAPDTSDPARVHWAQAKSAMARGAYRDALQEIEIILSLHPDDPWAQTYKSLCQRRLSSEKTFPALTPEQLVDLEARLRREESVQRQVSVQQKALERQLQQEQAKWNQQVKTLTAETLKARAAKEEAERRQMERRERDIAERARQIERQLATAKSGKPAATSPPPAAPSSVPASPPLAVTAAPSATPPPSPAATSPSPPAATLSQPPAAASPAGAASPSPAIPASAAGMSPPAEMPTPAPSSQQHMTIPVASPTPAALPSAGELPSSQPVAPAERPAVVPAPPAPSANAVQIFGDQMSVSPQRNLAVVQGRVHVLFPPDGDLTCDKLTFFTDTKDMYAQGHVRLKRNEDLTRGEMVHYNVTTHKGRALEGTVYREPWYEHGRLMEHLAEGVMRISPGYVTSCDFEPPHYYFQGRRSIVFAKDKILRSRNVSMFVGKVPLFYFPWLSAAERKTPFFLIPGKKKPWRQFALGGYRYEWPSVGQSGTIHLDWRMMFGWGGGLDHQLQSDRYGSALIKVYYNPDHNHARPRSDLPKGGEKNRYRILIRHRWEPMPDTTMVTDLQKMSDVDYRREMLFREEYVSDVAPGTDSSVEGGFVSWVTATPNYTVNASVRQRLNRFSTVTEAYPDLAVEVQPRPVGDTQLFVEAKSRLSNLQLKRAHSDDTDAVRVDWFEQLSYALSWLHPVLVTPKVGFRETYYNKDIQGGAERPDGKRNLFSAQFSTGTDASLKLFKVFPAKLTWLGMSNYWVRHVVTPTVAYEYIHPPTVPNNILQFPIAPGAINHITLGVENKLQTKRAGGKSGFRSVDLVRFLASIPYTFAGNNNKQGGRFGEWLFKLEFYPSSRLRIESDWKALSHLAQGADADSRVSIWNVDTVLIGGHRDADVHEAPPMKQPTLASAAALPTTFEQTLDTPQAHPGFQPGPQILSSTPLLPPGQWYLGLGHRFSANDKVETVTEWDWRLSRKWQLGAYHRFTWKEVAGGEKRFNNLREWQYTLTRDLHDWYGEFSYHVDREFGEELFFTFVLKAYPKMPVKMEDSYHQPKIGSQSSPFSPIRGQH